MPAVGRLWPSVDDDDGGGDDDGGDDDTDRIEIMDMESL